MSDLSDQRRYYERMIDEIADAHREQLDQLKAENARLKQELEAVGTAAYLYGRTDLAYENAKLREQTELLVTLLRNDCDIEASWDGLRHFWSIELTDDGCLMRDRVHKAESQIAELRELLQDYHRYEHEDCYSCRYINECRADESGRCIAPMRLSERYRELGVEVDQMERFNVPIPYGEDFPQVIRAQRNGEDFKTEYVEYAPRWDVDKRRQAVIVDKGMFFALTDTVDRLQEYSAKVTELARWMYQVMDESCAVHYPYEPAPVSMQALMRAEKELQALGIEVDE